VDPDLPLIRALQAGEDSALAELIGRHQTALLHFVYRYLHDETAARDVVHETFVRAYFKAATFEPRAAVKTWLHAIALNLCRDEFRRRGRRWKVIAEGGARGSSAPEPADPRPPPDEQASRQGRAEALHAAIARLPRTLREALVLFALDGKSQKEAADLLGTSPKTVELRVYHAKAKLRLWLRDGPGGSD